MNPIIILGLLAKKQDDTLNVGGRFYIKKGCEAYLDKEKGEIKIKNV